MKKVVSILLSVLLVFSSLTCIMTLPASAEGTVNCFENGVVLGADNEVVSNSNDYIGYTYTVNEEANATISAGDEVVATAKYDEDSPAYKFLGWYKGDELFSSEKTITFTAEEGVTYTPKLKSKNLLTKQGGYENHTAGTSFKLADYTVYPYDQYWGANANAGYLGKTVAGTIYDNSGNAYTQVDNTANANTGWGTATVSGDYFHSGSKSLHLVINTWTASTALKVEPGKTYTFSFWVLKAESATATTIKNIAVVTTLNVGTSSTPTDSDGNEVSSLKEKALSNAFTKLGLTLSNGNTSMGATTVSSEEWTQVTSSFTVPENALYDTVYLAIDASGGKNVPEFYIDDLTLYQHPEEVTPIADGVVVNVEGDEVPGSNDYIGCTYTVDGEETATVTEDSVVVATAEYDDSTPAYEFAGWYKNGELFSSEKTLTFTANSTDVYTPKLKSKNLLTEQGGYEGQTVGNSLKHTDTSASSYPTSALWGGNATTGYGQITNAETIYDNAGTAYQQVAYANETTGYNNGLSKVQVSSDYAHTGSNSLYFEIGTWTASTALKVEPGETYTFSFWIKKEEAHTLTLIKKVAVYTTLNIGNSSTPTNLDGTAATISLKNHVSNLSGYLALDLQNAGSKTISDIDLSENKWVQVTDTFTVPEDAQYDTVYLMVDASGDGKKYAQNFYIDDLILYQHIDPFNDCQVINNEMDVVEGSNDYFDYEYTSNGVENGDILEGSKVVATAKYDTSSPAYKFLGWYKNGTELVDDGAETIEFTVNSNDTYTPKLLSNNMLASSGSFENIALDTSLVYDATTGGTGPDYPKENEWGTNTNAGYCGQIFAVESYNADGSTFTPSVGGSASSVRVVATVTDKHTYSGDYALKLNPNWGVASLALENLRGNTTYTLTYKLLAPTYKKDVYENTIKSSAVVSTLNVTRLADLTSAIVMDVDDCRFKHNAVWNDDYTDFVSGDWLTITHTFTTFENQTVAYLVLPQTADTSGDTEYKGTTRYSQPAVAFIDDLTMCESVTTAYNGLASLREKGQGSATNTASTKNGLRVYNTIARSLVDSDEIVEFGSIVIRTARIPEGETLTHDTTNRAEGVAYKKDTATGTYSKYTLWNKTESAYEFTSYLTGIKKEYYDDNYSIRSYMKDADGNYHYGAVQEVCVYDILNAIDHGATASGAAQSDVDISAFKKFATEGGYDAYATWCEDNGRTTGTLYNTYYSASTVE